MVNRDHICIERCDTGLARHCQIVGELCLNGEHGHRLSIVQVYLTLPSACTVFVGKNREAHASSCSVKSGKFQKTQDESKQLSRICVGLLYTISLSFGIPEPHTRDVGSAQFYAFFVSVYLYYNVRERASH